MPEKRILTLPSTRFSRRFLLVFFIFVFSALSLVSAGTLESQDGWLYLSVARNLYYTGEATAAPNEYPFKNVNMNSFQAADGKWYAPGALGYSLAMVPAVFFSDLVHRYFGATPPVHFPLESDWSVLFFASFTNSFITAILAVGVLLYAHLLGLSKKQAVITALITVFATLLLPLSKHSFAQPLFMTGLLFTFLAIKRFGVTRRLRYLAFAAVAFIVVYFSYNVAYLIALLPLFIYFLFQLPQVWRARVLLLSLLASGGVMLLFPPLARFAWGHLQFEPKVLFEGAYGLLLSPGKSLFLYSPILLMLPLFWHKVPKKYLPEVVSFVLLTILFVFFYGKAWILGAANQFSPIWYGGNVWGPRYIAPLIPFLMILTMMAVFALTKLQKWLVVVPLVILSFGVQLVGISVPYILQYRDLPSTISVGLAEFSYYEYASFIPRYSPLLVLATESVKKVMTFKDTITHGPFNVRFFDGFEAPIKTGAGYVRGFTDQAYLSFENTPQNPVQKMSFRFDNRPTLEYATSSAQVTVSLNDVVMTEFTAPISTDITKDIEVPQSALRDGENILHFSSRYSPDPADSHVVYIMQMLLNDQNVNLGSLDYPDLSSLGYKTTPRPYLYYGQQVTDPWKFWYMRARINERTFDLWWIKNLYYWDRPKNLLWSLLALNLVTLGVSSFLVVRSLRRMSL